MKNKTKRISESRKFTVDVSDSGKFTVNIQDCRNFTVNISDCKNYSVNRQDCAGGVDAKNSVSDADAPKSCESCPFCSRLNVCKIMKRLAKEKIVSEYTVDHYIFEGKKPDWCPL